MTTDPVAALLTCLEARGFDPRPTGPDSWESRCPAHNGNRHNLSIRAGEGGRLLLHCHHAGPAGATCDYRAIDRRRPRHDRGRPLPAEFGPERGLGPV